MLLDLAERHHHLSVEISWQPPKVIRTAVDKLGAHRRTVGGDPPRGGEVHRQRLVHVACRVLVRERLGHARLPGVDREPGAVGDDDVREVE